MNEEMKADSDGIEYPIKQWDKDIHEIAIVNTILKVNRDAIAFQERADGEILVKIESLDFVPIALNKEDVVKEEERLRKLNGL